MTTIASQITSFTFCLLNRWFRRRSKITLKLRVTCLRVGNSPVTGEFPVKRASNTENVSIWWRHHANVETMNNLRKTNSMDSLRVHDTHITNTTEPYTYFTRHTKAGFLSTQTSLSVLSRPTTIIYLILFWWGYKTTIFIINPFLR